MIALYRFKEGILQSRILLDMEVVTDLLRKFSTFYERHVCSEEPDTCPYP